MPDPTLQATALRYAADDLTAAERAAFETRMAADQAACEALAEAVRLSAAVIGRPAPAPHPSFRAAIRRRLAPAGRHPLAWVGLGGVSVAVCALFAVSLADRTAPESVRTERPLPAVAEQAPAPRPVDPGPGEPAAAENLAPPACGDEARTVAEIWADLSNHDGVEKARDDEFRWRQRVRDLTYPHHVSTTARAAATIDAPHP